MSKHIQTPIVSTDPEGAEIIRRLQKEKREKDALTMKKLPRTQEKSPIFRERVLACAAYQGSR